MFPSSVPRLCSPGFSSDDRRVCHPVLRPCHLRPNWHQNCRHVEIPGHFINHRFDRTSPVYPPYRSLWTALAPYSWQPRKYGDFHHCNNSACCFPARIHQQQGRRLGLYHHHVGLQLQFQRHMWSSELDHSGRNFRHEDPIQRRVHRVYDIFCIQHDDRTGDWYRHGRCWMEVLLVVRRKYK